MQHVRRGDRETAEVMAATVVASCSDQGKDDDDDNGGGGGENATNDKPAINAINATTTIATATTNNIKIGVSCRKRRKASEDRSETEIAAAAALCDQCSSLIHRLPKGTIPIGT